MPIDRDAPITNIRTFGEYYLFSLESASVAGGARPGQFVMVRVAEGQFPLLRRPFSLHDASEGRIELFFSIAGMGTEILARKRPGETLDLLGPLGKGFSVTSALKGKTAFLVGGGRGIAPLYFLARELLAKEARPVLIYGGRREADLPLREKFEARHVPVICSTDDGSYGTRGLITEPLSREIERGRPDILFVCGPDPMMKAVADVAATTGVPAEFSLESIMGCGMGACWGCVNRIKDGTGAGWVKICEEGPVFPGDRIVWAD